MPKCIMCDTNESNDTPAVCNPCREARFPPEPEPIVPLEVPKPSFNIGEELRKMRDRINEILTVTGV